MTNTAVQIEKKPKMQDNANNDAVPEKKCASTSPKNIFMGISATVSLGSLLFRNDKGVTYAQRFLEMFLDSENKSREGWKEINGAVLLYFTNYYGMSLAHNLYNLVVNSSKEKGYFENAIKRELTDKHNFPLFAASTVGVGSLIIKDKDGLNYAHKFSDFIIGSKQPKSNKMTFAGFVNIVLLSELAFSMIGYTVQKIYNLVVDDKKEILTTFASLFIITLTISNKIC